ncbi:transposase [Clostridium sp. D2Q-11]|uniref:Transposase n=1 Tax=Anaeromonas frigoriresistens TaxID=2683708 RepID=A0A942UVM0_9FIRM|nr:transposase [Anaeromonas frigoriresistens]MBS4538315.1 transposase [Anaeromonas frigoriresistens]
MKKKNKRPSYILELRLETEKYQEDILNKRLEIGRQMYNATLGEALKRYNHLKRSRKYKELMKELIDINKKINNNKDNKKEKKLNKERKIIITKLNELRKESKLTEYDLHSYIVPMKRQFDCLDINTAQKIATRAWKSMENIIFGDGKKVSFKKYGQLDSLEGKNNTSGIRFRDNTLEWLRLAIPVRIRRNDIYAHEALQNKIKYCRIVRKVVKGKYKYYIQLVIEGTPPSKRDNKGDFKQKYGDSRVGIDPSLRSIAYSCDKEVGLQELAPSVDNLDKEIRRSQRKLDRSRRATNPNKFNPDSTIKKGSKDKWVRSQNYIKELFKLKELYRKLSDIRKIEHNILASYLLSLGTDIYVEKTDFKALAKKARETKVNEKTGRFKRKKRFGKSIGSKAPSKFFEVLNRKLGYIGKEIKYINPWTFKASQYDHHSDECNKVSLSNRWKDINNNKVQRDLYSAFLIMNSKKDLEITDRKKCLENFDIFLELHSKEINRIKKAKSLKIFSSFGIKREVQI